MTKEEAKNFIFQNPQKYLTKDKSGKGFICPICGSGSGKNGTGLILHKETHFKCFSCGFYGDMFEIIGKCEGLTDSAQIFNRAYEIFNIKIDTENFKPVSNFSPIPKNEKKENEKPLTDYTEFFKKCKQDLNKTEYWRKRGLSEAVLTRFWVGFCENWVNPGINKNGWTPPATPRLIIPTSKYSYLARDTRSDLTEKEKQFSKSKVGQVHIFNLDIVKGEKPVFVVEGEIDALSIIEVGGEAVGLGGVTNAEKFCEFLKTNKPRKPLILFFDNDKVGTATAGKIKIKLEEVGINYIEFEKDVFSDCKDANEMLVKNRELFATKINEAIEKANENALTDLERLENLSGFNSLQAFYETISANAQKSALSTGFKEVDRILDGGFFPGLYILGAISSLGKTTFCLQMAENLAIQGHNVLIFSLEMGRFELMAKSISRLTCINDIKNYNSVTSARTTRQILTCHYANETEYNLINQSVSQYAEYAKRIYIVEGVGDVTADRIRREVENFVKLKGEKPVIFIDYLQIIAPPKNFFGTDKKNTDSAVTDLKRLSRDFDTPVIAISSFNRDNYNTAVNMASFKESGAIEYSSDVLIGLQFAGMDSLSTATNKKDEEKNKNSAFAIYEANKEKAKKGEFQDIQVKILKNRNGSKDTADIQFLSKFNLFRDKPKQQ